MKPAVIKSILNIEDEKEEASKKLYRRSELALEFFLKQVLFRFVEDLCESFGKVEVIEHYGNYMRLRVDK